MKNLVAPSALTLLASPALAQEPFDVESHVLVTQGLGGFGGDPSVSIRGFGHAMDSIGDLDGNGYEDLIVGAGTSTIGLDWNIGAAWILFLGPGGSVIGEVAISEGLGGFGTGLDAFDQFGSGVASLGDVDGDGVVDVAVSARLDDDGATDAGAIWILFLDPGGTVKSKTKISATSGGLGMTPSFLGQSLGTIGDLDGDGIAELLTTELGSLQVLFLDSTGSVASRTEIDDDAFGTFSCYAVDGLGDFDGDGVSDAVVGYPFNNCNEDLSICTGVVHLLLLNADGSLKDSVPIVPGPQTTGTLFQDDDKFGISVESLGDVDGDGVTDLVVGESGEDDVGGGLLTNAGAIWILRLAPDGSVAASKKISETTGGFTADLGSNDRFGASIVGPGDLDGDGDADLLVGASGESTGSPSLGGYYALHLTPPHGTPYGCGLNPAGSLVEVSGAPALGSSWKLALDNPLDTQLPGSVAILGVSPAALGGGGCGPVIPGYGMASAAAGGELLVDLTAGLVQFGPAIWSPGSPAWIDVAVPTLPALTGLPIFTQGAIVDGVVGIGITRALTTTILP